MVCYWCACTLAKRTSWATQVFNLQVIHLWNESGKNSSFFLSCTCTHVHSRPKFQQLLLDMQPRMAHFKLFQVRQRSCYSVLNWQWDCIGSDDWYWAKLARFGTIQPKRILVYCRKRKHTILCCTKLYHGQMLVYTHYKSYEWIFIIITDKNVFHYNKQIYVKYDQGILIEWSLKHNW